MGKMNRLPQVAGYSTASPPSTSIKKKLSLSPLFPYLFFSYVDQADLELPLARDDFHLLILFLLPLGLRVCAPLGY